MSVRLSGANEHATATPLETLPGVSHYLVGDDPSKWRRNVASYSGVRYHDVYPGIDVVYRGRDGAFEYEFVIAPGADPGSIELQVEGSPDIEVSASGELLISTPHGRIHHAAPAAFEGQRSVGVGFRKKGRGRIGFDVTGHEAANTLRIDPTIYLETYDFAIYDLCWPDVTVDSGGFAYVVCTAIGAGGSFDAFVAKLDPDGTLIRTTWLGSTGFDLGIAVAVDNAGRLAVVGTTQLYGAGNTNMDLPNCTAPRGASDAFFVWLDSSGASVTYGTCISGTHGDEPLDVALDAAGNAYVTGVTDSGDFMGVGPAGYRQGPSCFPTATCQDAFVVKIPVAGGNGYVRILDEAPGNGTSDGRDSGNSIAVQATGEAWVVGTTESDQLCTTPRDAFLIRLDAQGAQTLLTCLGGSSYDQGYGVAVDGFGNAYVVGTTGSRDFPLVNPWQSTVSNPSPVWSFMSKIDPAGQLVASTVYLDPDLVDHGDEAASVAVDLNNNIYVGGYHHYTWGPPEDPDIYWAWVARFDSNLQRTARERISILDYTYMWGGITVGGDGKIYAVGQANAENGPYRLFAVAWEAEAFGMRPDCRKCPNVGQPVNIVTGNMWLDQTDLVVPGFDQPLALVRSYNNQAALGGTVGGFGLGWAYPYERRMILTSGTLRFVGGDGVPIIYKDGDGDGVYRAEIPATEKSWVTTSSGVLTRHFREGGSEIYQDGLLSQLVSATGATTTVSRSASAVTIAEQGGRSLVLASNSLGLVTSATGPLGLIAEYEYDAGRRLRSVSYPDGGGYDFTYDSGGQLLEVTDTTGRVIERHAYADGKATVSEVGQAAEGNGVQERLTIVYTPTQTVVTDQEGTITTYTWSEVAGSRVVTTKAVTGGGLTSTEHYTYTPEGRVATHTDANSHVTTYTYNAEGDLTTETDPLNRVTTYAYTYDGATGRVLTRTRTAPDQGTTTSTFGLAGPLSITEPLTATQNRTTTFTYSGSKVATIVSPGQGETSFEYFTSGDLEAVTDPLGQRTSFEYDELGRRVRTIDPLQKATLTDYDGRGRVLRVTTHDGARTEFSYDAAGRRLTAKDALDRTTTYTYDGAGRLATVVDAASGTTTYAYDDMSRLLSLTDGRGQTTTYEYDGLGRMKKTVWPGGPFETFTYDAGGRLTTRIDRRNITTTYVHDAADRLTSKNFSDTTPDQSFGYDGADRLTSASSSIDALTRTYDLAGRMLTESSTNSGLTPTYTYDAADNRLSLGGGAGLPLTYGYESGLRLATMTRGTNVSSFSYDAANRRTALAYPNGLTTAYTYDDLGRLLTLSSGVDTWTYAYDLAGNRTSKQGAAIVEAYGYDTLHRLTSSARTGAPAASWVYDAVGNRVQEQVGATVREGTFSVRNELTEIVAADGATFTYDAAGNLATKTEGGVTWTYEWNAENQLTRVLANAVEAARFKYDPLGRRVQKVAGAQTTAWAYDGQDILQETITGGTGAGTFRYGHGPGIDEPLARLNTSTGAVIYLHADGLGSITKATNQSGAVLGNRQYDAWGNLEAGSSTPGYAFTGREWDPEIGLYYYRARYYDSTIGGFISEDPIRFAGGVNFFAYVGNNPIDRTDPFGWDWLEFRFNGSLPTGGLYWMNNDGSIRSTYSGISGTMSGSQPRLPLGVYKGDNFRKRTRADMSCPGNDQPGWSLNLTPQFPTNRTLLRIHPDATTPPSGLGTEGCIGTDCLDADRLFQDLDTWFKAGSKDIDVYVFQQIL